MATATLSELLKTSKSQQTAIKLKEDLHVLEHVLKYNGDYMFITTCKDETIKVYAPLEYKAYIPKRYDDYHVTFVGWDDNIKFELSEEIYI
jgi:hypothetical protein